MVFVNDGMYHNTVQNFALPLGFQFVLIPVYLVVLFRHDQYFLTDYCSTRYKSERQLYVARIVTLLFDTALFYIPLFLFYLVYVLPSRLSLGRILAFALNVFIGFLLLGLLCSILHQMTRRYLPVLIIYVLLFVDAVISIGALVIKFSFFYLPVLDPWNLDDLASYLRHVLLMLIALIVLAVLGWFLAGIRRGGIRHVEK